MQDGYYESYESAVQRLKAIDNWHKANPDPKYQCAYVTRKGTRCTRMTTVIYCQQHVEVIARQMSGHMSKSQL